MSMHGEREFSCSMLGVNISHIPVMIKSQHDKEKMVSNDFLWEGSVMRYKPAVFLYSPICFGWIQNVDMQDENEFLCIVPSPTYHPPLRVPSLFHRPASLHPLRGNVRRPTGLHHLAEGWKPNPSQSGCHHRQHRLYQLAAHIQPHTDAQWQLHLHCTQPGRCCRAPESAHCPRWEGVINKRVCW